MNEKQQRQALRREILKEYGDKCACCGETTHQFLVIDHIHNGGAQHRRELKAAGITIYQDLGRRGCPRDNFQILCFNCNSAKQTYGICPHEEARELAADVEFDREINCYLAQTGASFRV